MFNLDVESCLILYHVTYFSITNLKASQHLCSADMKACVNVHCKKKKKFSSAQQYISTYLIHIKLSTLVVKPGV